MKIYTCLLIKFSFTYVELIQYFTDNVLKKINPKIIFFIFYSAMANEILRFYFSDVKKQLPQKSQRIRNSQCAAVVVLRYNLKYLWTNVQLSFSFSQNKIASPRLVVLFFIFFIWRFAAVYQTERIEHHVRTNFRSARIARI